MESNLIQMACISGEVKSREELSLQDSMEFFMNGSPFSRILCVLGESKKKSKKKEKEKKAIFCSCKIYISGYFGDELYYGDFCSASLCSLGVWGHLVACARAYTSQITCVTGHYKEPESWKCSCKSTSAGLHPGGMEAFPLKHPELCITPLQNCVSLLNQSLWKAEANKSHTSLGACLSIYS